MIAELGRLRTPLAGAQVTVASRSVMFNNAKAAVEEIVKTEEGTRADGR
jgi:hypothetical protein